MAIRKIGIIRLIIAFILTIIIFTSGFLFSYRVSSLAYSRSISLQNEIQNEIKFISTGKCQDFSSYTSEDLEKAGFIISILEERFGKEDARVILEKEKYADLEVKHMYAIKELTERCKKKMNYILFFYSNKEEFRDDAELKGYILSKIKENTPEEIMIYSFDYDINSQTVKILKEIYKIKTPNTVIINEKNKLVEFNNILQVNGFIN